MLTLGQIDLNGGGIRPGSPIGARDLVFDLTDLCAIYENGIDTGVYTINVDGAEAGKIVNTIPGTDWRSWTDSSTIKINLTEGEHTVRIVMGSDGPNLYGVKFAYAEPQE